MSKNNHLMKLYRDRFRQHEANLALVREISKLQPTIIDNDSFENLFELISKSLPCLAMVLTKTTNLHLFPNNTEQFSPKDWNGWIKIDWQQFCQRGPSETPIKLLLNSDSGSQEITLIPILIKRKNSKHETEIIIFIADLPGPLAKAKSIEQSFQIVGAQISMARGIHLNLKTIETQEKSNKLLIEARTQTLKALTKALDSRDNYTRGHSERVAEYAKTTAKMLEKHFPEIITGRDAELKEQGVFVETCELAGQLHDIGKIGMGDFLKLDRSLTDNEFVEMKCHVRESARILSQIEEFRCKGVDLAALWHHERLDKKGYLGKSDEEISVCAKILAIADSYDAMTSDRSYREKLPWYVALDDLRCNSILAEKDTCLYNTKIFLAFENAVVEEPENICPGWKDDDKNIQNKIKEALSIITSDINKTDEYSKVLENASNLRFYEVSKKFPGTLNLLKQNYFEKEIDDMSTMQRNGRNSLSTFSIGLIKWADENEVSRRLEAVNKAMKQQGDPRFRLSRFKDAFVVYSKTLPDRSIYNAFLKLAPVNGEKIKENEQEYFLGPFGIVTMLDHNPDPRKKLEECYNRLNLFIEKTGVNGTKPNSPVQFWRDREEI